MSGMDFDDDEDGFTSRDDAAAVGFKVIEAANRVKQMNSAVPGAVGTWFFEIDDVRFRVAVTVEASS